MKYNATDWINLLYSMAVWWEEPLQQEYLFKLALSCEWAPLKFPWTLPLSTDIPNWDKDWWQADVSAEIRKGKRYQVGCLTCPWLWQCLAWLPFSTWLSFCCVLARIFPSVPAISPSQFVILRIPGVTVNQAFPTPPPYKNYTSLTRHTVQYTGRTRWTHCQGVTHHAI